MNIIRQIRCSNLDHVEILEFMHRNIQINSFYFFLISLQCITIYIFLLKFLNTIALIYKGNDILVRISKVSLIQIPKKNYFLKIKTQDPNCFEPKKMSIHMIWSNKNE